MTGDTPYQPADGPDDASEDGEQVLTFEAAGSLADPPLDSEPQVQVERIEVGRVPVGETPSGGGGPGFEEVTLAESPVRPWWKRLFADLFGHNGQAAIEVEAELVLEPGRPTPALSLAEEGMPVGEVHPSDVPLQPPSLEEPVLQAAEDEVAPLTENVLPEKAPPPAPALSADAVRALVQEELDQARGDVPRLVQAELARERQDHRCAALSALQEVADDTSEVKIEFLVTELEVLNEEEQRTLQEPGIPVRERMNLLDFIRERRTQVKQQIAEAETAVAQRIAETDLALAELEGRDIVARLREELERQKEQISKYANQQRELAQQAARRPLIGAGAGVVPALLVLVLVAAMGMAGILLPRQTDPAPSFLVEMATLYQATGEKEAAARLLDDAVEAGIDDVETLGQVGQTYYALTEYDEAVEVLSRAVEKAPKNEEYRLALARSYGKAEQYQEAIAHYEKLIDADPVNWHYHLEMGQQYEALKDYDQALGQYQKVAEVAPDCVEGYTSQGNLYRDLERYDAAIPAYQRALEIDPNMWWVRLFLGQSYMALQDWDRAVEQLRAAVELAPDNPAPYLELGKVWRAQGEYEEALSWYQDALDVQPDHVPTFLEMGDTYLELEDCEQATLWFLRVLEIRPDNKVAQDGLGACQGE